MVPKGRYAPPGSNFPACWQLFPNIVLDPATGELELKRSRSLSTVTGLRQSFQRLDPRGRPVASIWQSKQSCPGSSTAIPIWSVRSMPAAAIPASSPDPGLRKPLIGVKHASEMLRAGFTTVRDVGSFRAFADVALRDAIDAGWVEGPRMICAGTYRHPPRRRRRYHRSGDRLDEVVPRELRFGIGAGPDRLRALVARSSAEEPS